MNFVFCIDFFIELIYNTMCCDGVWRSLVSRLVRDQEAVGSSPATPTMKSIHKGFDFMNTLFVCKAGIKPAYFYAVIQSILSSGIARHLMNL